MIALVVIGWDMVFKGSGADSSGEVVGDVVEVVVVVAMVATLRS